MLKMGWIQLRFNQQTKKSNSTTNNFSHGSLLGLRIITLDNHNHSFLIISASDFKKPKTQQFPCFLKCCSLCNKSLGPDKEVYMYRGDQGFCSVECRTRQICIDERREIEIYKRNRVESFRRRRDRRCDTEFRHRSSPVSNRRAIFTLS